MKVSNISIKNSMVSQIKRNYEDLQKTEKQLMTGKRYHSVSENTPNAITSIYSKIRSNQIEQYIKNAEDSESYIDVAHDKLSNMTKMMHRIKELNIQGANGPLSTMDRNYIAGEVEEILKEMVSQANTSYQDNYLFSGSKDVTPFSITYDLNFDLGREVISSVEYRGDDFVQHREVGQKEEVQISLPGSQAFWGQNQSILSLKDNTGFVASADQKIRIDGYEVLINQNDNLERIIEKINEKVPSMTAFKQDLPNGSITLGVESQYPHKIFLEDMEGGSLLRDVGMIQPGEAGNHPPNNLHSNVLKKGGSIFEVLIDLRNSLITNNVEDLGSRNLVAVDDSINSLLRNQAKISSVQSRLENVRKDLSTELVTMRERISKSEDMDIAEATIRFNEINSLHQLGLKATAKYIRPTLLDYL